MKKTASNKIVNVTYFQRRPYDAYFSIERVFDIVRENSSSNVKYKVLVSKYYSRGIFPRIYNCLEACINQNEINHITGDIHYLVCFLKKNRTILTIHDCVTLNRLKGIKKWVFWLFWYWMPIKKVKFITVVSEFTKKEVLKWVHCDPQKIHVIPNPIQKEFLIHKSPKRRNKKQIVLQIGISKNKNLKRLIEALNGVSCHLRIVGKITNEYRELLRINGIDYSYVYNLNSSALLKEYIKCDIVVFASTYEGFGLPIIEAQAVGRPVVTSNICSMPEVAGNAACIVDPYDVENIRMGILKVLKDKAYYNKLVNLGFKNIERFNPKLIANKYLLLYEEIISYNVKETSKKVL